MKYNKRDITIPRAVAVSDFRSTASIRQRLADGPPADETDTYPNAALTLWRKATAAGMHCQIVGPGPDCAVQIQDPARCDSFLAMYRGGKAHRAWMWPLRDPTRVVNVAGVGRIGFRELGKILTEREISE